MKNWVETRKLFVPTTGPAMVSVLPTFGNRQFLLIASAPFPAYNAEYRLKGIHRPFFSGDRRGHLPCLV